MSRVAEVQQKIFLWGHRLISGALYPRDEYKYLRYYQPPYSTSVATTRAYIDCTLSVVYLTYRNLHRVCVNYILYNVHTPTGRGARVFVNSYALGVSSARPCLSGTPSVMERREPHKRVRLTQRTNTNIIALCNTPYMTVLEKSNASRELFGMIVCERKEGWRVTASMSKMTRASEYRDSSGVTTKSVSDMICRKFLFNILSA